MCVIDNFLVDEIDLKLNIINFVSAINELFMKL